MKIQQIQTVNEAGLAFIAQKLGKLHKQFSNSAPTRAMLLAWAADAERSLDEGNGAELEIRSWDAVSGRTELVQLDETDHFTATQQAIGE